MDRLIEIHRHSRLVVFDLLDAFAKDRGLSGDFPRPLGRLKLQAVGRLDDGVPEPLDPPYDLAAIRTASGFYVSDGRMRRSRGHPLIAAGRYVIRISGEYYQAAEQEVTFPEPDQPAYAVDLEPNHAYPFARPEASARIDSPTLLRGDVLTPEGQGVEGATIQVPGQSNVYRTDDTGAWVLWFGRPKDVFAGDANEAQVALRVDLPGEPPVHYNVPGVKLRRGFTSSLAQTALRGRVTAAGGLGVASARVRITNPNVEAATADDGRWAYCYRLNKRSARVRVQAFHPDGRTLPPRDAEVKRRETVTVPTFEFA